MKKTPPDIYPRNNCAKFQPKRTIFEVSSTPQSFGTYTQTDTHIHTQTLSDSSSTEVENSNTEVEFLFFSPAAHLFTSEKFYRSHGNHGKNSQHKCQTFCFDINKIWSHAITQEKSPNHAITQIAGGLYNTIIQIFFKKLTYLYILRDLREVNSTQHSFMNTIHI